MKRFIIQGTFSNPRSMGIVLRIWDAWRRWWLGVSEPSTVSIDGENILDIEAQMPPNRTTLWKMAKLQIACPGQLLLHKYQSQRKKAPANASSDSGRAVHPMHSRLREDRQLQHALGKIFTSSALLTIACIQFQIPISIVSVLLHQGFY